MAYFLDYKRTYTLPDEIEEHVPPIGNFETIFNTALIRRGNQQYTYMTGVTRDHRFFRLIVDLIGKATGICLYAQEFAPSVHFRREAQLDRETLDTKLQKALFGNPQTVLQGFQGRVADG